MTMGISLLIYGRVDLMVALYPPRSSPFENNLICMLLMSSDPFCTALRISAMYGVGEGNACFEHLCNIGGAPLLSNEDLL